MVDIQPARGGQNVPSSADVQIRFDRGVDRASVERHFHVDPATAGEMTWPAANQMVFKHDPFLPGTQYSVSLDAGYRDRSGVANGLNHGWIFRTEPAPQLVTASPGPGDRYVDPAGVISLTFSREMNVSSLTPAVSLSPSTRLSLRRDAADPLRVVVAPAGLLTPNTTYSLAVTRDAIDVDGNHLASGVTLSFVTGAQRPLRHWVTVSTADPSGPTGVFVIDESRLPREVVGLGVRQFSWSIDGARILVQSPAGSWFDVDPMGSARQLPFSADWAAFLAPGLGYATLEGGRLNQVTPAGDVVPVANPVGQVAVDPTGTRLGYVAGPARDELWDYAVELRAHARLQVEAAAIDGLAWAPDGNRVAYRLAASDSNRWLLRVRAFDGRSQPVITAAVGRIGIPAWDADSRHLIVDGRVVSATSTVNRVFRISALANAEASLSADQAIPTPTGLDVHSPVLSPDGRQLAFISDVGGFAQAWLMNVDGTGAAPLTRYDSSSFPYSVVALTWTRT